MEHKLTPRAGFVAFGYPGYPEGYLKRFTQESVEMLQGLGIGLIQAPRVDTFADAAQAREALRAHDFDFLIVLVLSWLEAPKVLEVVKEFSHRPILLWSHTMFREDGEWRTLGAIPGVGVIRQTFEELGLGFKFAYGMPDEKKVADGTLLFAKAAATAHQLRESKIGLLGYASMGMYTANFDHLPLREKLGPEVEQLDQYVLIKRIEEMDDARVADLFGRVKREWEIGAKVTDRDLTTTLKMYQALRDLVEKHGWQALQVKCQYELSKEYKSVPCVPLSMLAGEIPCSCEGDVLLVVSQLMLHYLTGQVTSYGDIHTIEEHSILLGACGYAAFGLCEGRPKVDRTEIMYEGVANCTLYREGRVTLARLGYQRDRSLKLHIVTGEGKHPRPFREVGCLPYPAMEMTLDGSGDELAQTLMSQHYAIVYGDHKEELLELARILSLEPKVV